VAKDPTAAAAGAVTSNLAVLAAATVVPTASCPRIVPGFVSGTSPLRNAFMVASLVAWNR